MLSLKPKVVIEIGTGAGLSAVSMKKCLPPGSKIVTFDLIDWKSYPDSCLREDDFKDGRLVQYTDDLSDPSMVAKHSPLLEQANMIFIDAAKDGIMEQRLLDNFRSISFITEPLIVFDDIRLWNMLKIWRNISLPKLDLTSFGHWCGTGVIQCK
jgi:predicted O-methyltransferase YrrM